MLCSPVYGRPHKNIGARVYLYIKNWWPKQAGTIPKKKTESLWKQAESAGTIWNGKLDSFFCAQLIVACQDKTLILFNSKNISKGEQLSHLNNKEIMYVHCQN
jgi:hypothetical protein